MISVKCGSCGMVFNLTEESAASRRIVKCPNCLAEIPDSIATSVLQLSKALVENPDSWKIYILPSHEELCKLQL